MNQPNQTTQSGYRQQMQSAPDYSMMTVTLQPDRPLMVEASAMAFMDSNIRMKTRMKGGLARLLTGESMFVNEYQAEGGPGDIGVAPAAPGEIHHVVLDGRPLYMQNSAFLACSPSVKLETKWQGLVRGFFATQSLFLIRAVGAGDLWFNTFGSAVEIDVQGEYIVDTGCIAAFTDGLEYEVSRIGGYKSLFFSGEGFVCRFRGTGKVWVQSRNPAPFAFAFNPFRPRKKQSE